MISPKVFDILFDGTTKWTIVVKTRHAIIDFETLNEEKLSFEKIDALFAHVFFCIVSLNNKNG